MTDTTTLEALARTAFTYGDDYVLESHVHYSTVAIGNQQLKLTPSAHIRAGKLADGITLQFTEGTSWVGNFYVSETLAPTLGISLAQYQAILKTIDNFRIACQQESSGLAIAGMDFAIGQIGGKFGEAVLLGVQDPNISFNGAEFLREFMQRTHLQKGWASNSFFAATWVFVPNASCTHDRLNEMLQQQAVAETHAIVVAVVPNYWAMIGVAALDYALFVHHFEQLQATIKTDFAR